jgi:cytochrome c-type biogenesis protein CcmH
MHRYRRRSEILISLVRAPTIVLFAGIFCLLLTSLPLRAVESNEMLADPVLEARARVLSKGLRCMVCQNQSIDDSEAPLAHDLRVLVRERLKAGDSDPQVLDFLVARYGEFVLLKPPLSWHTAALWGLPPAALLIGMTALVLVVRRRRTASTEPGNLTRAEEARLSELLRDGS